MNESAAVGLRSLDALVHTHREQRVTFETWGGATEEQLLGDLTWLHVPDDATETAFALADLWAAWETEI